MTQISSFDDTKNHRRIQWGWAQEDMNEFGTTQQGYQGAYALPREIFIKDTHGVVHDASHTTPGNSRYIHHANGTWTASTLGVRPAPDVVEGLHHGASHTQYPCGGSTCTAKEIVLPSKLSRSYQLDVRIERTSGVAGVTIGASPGREEYTNIYFDPSNNTIGVDRTHSTLINMFSNSSHVGYFEPYRFQQESGKLNTESIQMSIFVDGSLVEVYVNDRFALTSRIYPSREDSSGIALFAAPGVDARYSHVELWDGLLDVWPKRPQNSSSQLVFDTPEATGDYHWWAGN